MFEEMRARSQTAAAANTRGTATIFLLDRAFSPCNPATMKNTTLFSLLAAASLSLSSMALAGSAKTYQVTGPVLEMNDNMIAVQKGKDRWEIARDTSSKVPSGLKVGDKVTITYTMTAKDVEMKPAKGSPQKKE